MRSKQFVSQHSMIAQAYRTPLIEPLEARRLLHAAIVSPISDVNLSNAATSSVIDLHDRYVGTTVEFDTTLGKIDVELTDTVTPKTVANFLNYLDRYAGTFFHRFAKLTGGTPFVLQGGGYKPDNSFAHIAQDATVQNEFQQGVTTNVLGTIAMAKLGSDPNSASSEFFFNLGDNSGNLDTQNGGFTTFGRITAGQSVLDAITALQPQDITTQTGNGAMNETPLQAGGQVPADLVFINSVSKLANTLSVDSSNPGLVTAAISGERLTLTYVAGATGTADITVKITTPDGGETDDTFTVTRTSDNVVKLGVGGFKTVSYTDPDGTAAIVSLNKGSANLVFSGANVQVQTLPGNRAVVTGDAGATITSIDTTGTDTKTSLTITGRGGDGKVDIQEISTDAGLALLSGKIVNITNQLLIDGNAATLLLGSAKAVSVLGDGVSAIIGSLTGSLKYSGTAKLISLTSSTGAKIDVGPGGVRSLLTLIDQTANDTSVTSATPMSSIITRGWNNTDAVDDLITASSIGAISSAGNFVASVTLNSAARLALTAAKIKAITGGFWQITGNVGAIVAGSVADTWSTNIRGNLGVLGAGSGIAGNVVAKSIGVFGAKGNLSGQIRVNGAMKALTTGAISGGINASSIGALVAKGDMQNATVSTSSIGTMTVSGNLKDSTVTLGGPFAARSFSLRALTVIGQIANSTVASTHGNIGSIVAGAILNKSVIVAGIAPTGVPSVATDFTDPATITKLLVRRGVTTTFKDCRIFSRFMGVFNLGSIATDNGQTRYGMIADKIKLVTVFSGGKPFVFKNLAAPSQNLSGGDFLINLVD